MTRYPAVSGSFYPGDSEELKKMIKNFIDKVEPKRKKCFGAVVPHAGYVYCGKTAAYVYCNISTGFETAIILGPNHSGMGIGVATSLENWKTPLGTIETDKDFVNELIKDSVISEDENSHLYEHSIEVQLPWLQFRFKDFKIVPIAINPIYYDVKTCKEVGEKIAETAKALRRKVLIIASSDFTHYGSIYGYEPFKGSVNEILKKLKETDMEVINLIKSLKPAEVIKVCNEKNLTICGYGGIAAMLFAVKELGAKQSELLDYSTSFDVSKDISAVVGYAGIIIF
ncbi:MAG: MEMO1 family protein [Candidatus Aenigmatarchaeota archaeon]